MLRIGINGFGRIGRAIFRINTISKIFEVVAINDTNPSSDNLAYMLKYDSTYGKMENEITCESGNLLLDNQKPIPIHHDQSIKDVPWEKYDVDIIIDSSGIFENIKHKNILLGKGIKHQIVTNTPESEFINKYVVLGVNESELFEGENFLISSSICDANAFSPVMNIINSNYGIDHGFLTTLHPWLAYQNLLDGPSRSYAYPGTIHENFSLGRASVNAMIPKTTSAIRASKKVLPFLEDKFQSLSFRVPTSIVSAADVSVKLVKATTKEDIITNFSQYEEQQKYRIIHNNFAPLVSTDYIKSNYSAIIDHSWTQINDANYLKLILWYDNEWGYSSRVLDVIRYIEENSIQ
jgi:glyceraldehyde 3-phosphate dehydrogenase